MAKHGKQRRDGRERQRLRLAQTLLFASLVGACNHSERKNSSRAAASVVVSATPASSASSAPSAASAPSASPAPSAASALPAAAPIPRGTKRSAVATGYSTGLRLDANTLIYCDDRGSRGLDLISGVDSARSDPCPKKNLERNGACDGIEYVDQVRTPWQEGMPGPGPNDIIDTKSGMSIPAHGRVHDCVFNNGVLLFVTGVETVAIDIKTDRHHRLGKDGGNEVAINDAWLAWSDYKKVFAERR